jgi:hypothetical protein
MVGIPLRVCWDGKIIVVAKTKYDVRTDKYSALGRGLAKPTKDSMVHNDDGPVMALSHNQDPRAPARAQQKKVHEFHADRDHAMCNIQNRSAARTALKTIQYELLRALVLS